jgi:dolichol kinase
MTQSDLLALGITFGYATALLALAEVIRRWRGYPQDFTRKIVHIGAGMWVFGVLALFENWYIGVIPFLAFIVLNFLFYHFRVFDSVDDEGSTPGTVYFALSISVLFLVLWRTDSPLDLGYVAAGGTMAMTWGDALASIVGRRWGKHRYTIGNDTRSWEGSAAMFLSSSIAIFLTLLLVPGSSLSPMTEPLGVGVCLVSTLIAATVATLAEGVSPAGSDNLSVPLLAGGALYVSLLFLS